MTTTMRRLFTVARSASLIVAFASTVSHAADLPFEPGRGPTLVQHVVPSRSYTALQWPIIPQPHRFDIYGNPIGGYLIALPDPLVVDSGCPKALEPTYDTEGNLAGYAPIVACR